MLKKIFLALLIMSVLSSGLLFFLLRRSSFDAKSIPLLSRHDKEKTEEKSESPKPVEAAESEENSHQETLAEEHPEAKENDRIKATNDSAEPLKTELPETVADDSAKNLVPHADEKTQAEAPRYVVCACATPETPPPAGEPS